MIINLWKGSGNLVTNTRNTLALLMIQGALLPCTLHFREFSPLIEPVESRSVEQPTCRFPERSRWKLRQLGSALRSSWVCCTRCKSSAPNPDPNAFQCLRCCCIRMRLYFSFLSSYLNTSYRSFCFSLRHFVVLFSYHHFVRFLLHFHTFSTRILPINTENISTYLFSLNDCRFWKRIW